MIAPPGSKPWTVQRWYTEVPPVTRILLTLTFLGHILSLWLPPGSLALTWRCLFFLEIWRPWTASVGTAQISIGSLFHFVLLHRFSVQVERDMFPSRPLDYLWTCLVMMSFVTVLCLFVGEPFTSSALVPALLFMWCRTRPNLEMMLPFVKARIKALYYPVALMAVYMLFGGSFLVEVCGTLGGHLYVYCTVLRRSQYSWVFDVPQWVGKSLQHHHERQMKGKVLPW